MWALEVVLISYLSCRYIDFYLDMLGTPETVSLLHHLASKAKTVRDADNRTESEARTLWFVLATMLNSEYRICIS